MPPEQLLDPVRGNVTFSAAQSGWSFSLQSFARLYAEIYGAGFDPRWAVAEAGLAPDVGASGGGLGSALAVSMRGKGCGFMALRSIPTSTALEMEEGARG